MTKLYQTALPLLLILLLASALRLTALLSFPPALFSDEVDVALQVKSFLATGRDYYGNFLPLQFRSFSDVRTAIPIYLTALIAKILPNIELVVRLEAALMGLISIAGIYLLAKAFFGRGVGLTAALLLTLTPWHFTYSRAGFEATTLMAFFVFGIYFIKRYFDTKSQRHLWLGTALLSATPLVYSTAKLSLFFLPPLILFFPGTTVARNLRNKKLILSLVLLFFPLVVVSLSGGVASRFSYISIFTDPTTPTEINVARKQDQGEDLPLGTKPLLASRVFRNKLVVFSQRVSNNLFELLSTKFLFVKGDPNLRHALPDWGMLYKSEAVFLLVGLYLLVKKARPGGLVFAFGLILLAILPGSLTRDGGSHATRSFLLLLPITLASAVGGAALVKRGLWPLLFLPIFIFESGFYFFDYFHRYVFISERQWDSGFKQVISLAEEKKAPVVISDSYDPPLIFYLFYSDYPLERMQELIRTDRLLVPAPDALNLSGRKIADRDVYFASVANRNLANPLQLKPGHYYLLETDLPNHKHYFTSDRVAVKLPSGLPLFYEISAAKVATSPVSDRGIQGQLPAATRE